MGRDGHRHDDRRVHGVSSPLERRPFARAAPFVSGKRRPSAESFCVMCYKAATAGIPGDVHELGKAPGNNKCAVIRGA